VGAGVTGWVLLGNLGFQGTVRLAGFLNLGAAGLVLTLWRLAARVPAAGPTPDLAPPGAAAARSASIGWYLVYGLTGAVALGLEVVFFRVIDAVMRGNSYTFGHVLMLYLLLFGAGAAIASRYVGRARRPDRWFLGLQFAVGVAALVGLLVLVELPGRIGLDGPLDRLFAIDGFDPGQYDLGSFREVARFLFVHAGAPLLVMGLPVLCTGASFPFVQALVAQRLYTLGRRTGALVAANVVGNVLGTLVVGFVLLDRLGTSGTVRLLAGLLVLPGLAFAATHVGWARVTFGTGGVVALAALMGVFPSNPRLWAFLHSADASRFTLAEERSCVNALKPRQGEDLLFVNGISQNAYPFDDFHVLIGLLPTLLHPAPDSAVAVGLGIGATPYGISRDPRVGSLTVAELCGGEVALQRVLAGRGAPEPARLLGDPRVRIRIGDGRKALLAAPEERFDLATVDVVRPQSGSSGSLYSVEFYRLLASRLQDDGLFSQWSPTPRTLNSVTEVFPYVSRFTVPSYYGSQFVVASRRPIPFDREAVLGRLAGLEPDAFLPARAEALAQFLRSVEPEQIRAGGPPVPVDGRDLNRDLRPLDEFFLNNPEAVPERPRSP